MKPRVLKALIATAILSVIAALLLPAIASGLLDTISVLIGILVLAFAIAIPFLLLRWRPLLVVPWLIVYIVVYILLAFRGHYIGANFGGNDNRDVWYPSHCGEAYMSPMGRTHCSLTSLGWFFLPVIIPDRILLHPTRESD